MSKRLRDEKASAVLGYALDRETLTPIREYVDLDKEGDYGADPLGDGLFRMFPSGDVVSYEERNRRLSKQIKAEREG